MKKQNNTVRGINTIWITACGLLFLLPLLWMLSSSVKAGPEVFATNFKCIPDKIQWENYVRVWTNKEVPFWKLYVNSGLIAVVGTLGQLIISSMAGYSLGLVEGKNLVFILMLVTMMIPTQATIIPRFVLFKGIGIYNTLWSLILPAFFNVTSIFLLRQFYMSLPRALMEAARVDGANHFQIWSKVMMPLTKPAMVTVTVLSFINSWNEYLNALIFLPSTRNYTVSLGIQYWMQIWRQERPISGPLRPMCTKRGMAFWYVIMTRPWMPCIMAPAPLPK